MMEVTGHHGHHSGSVLTALEGPDEPGPWERLIRSVAGDRRWMESREWRYSDDARQTSCAVN
jgi:hypothetical protein